MCATGQMPSLKMMKNHLRGFVHMALRAGQEAHCLHTFKSRKRLSWKLATFSQFD